MRMAKVAGSGYDEFYTPEYAIEPLLPYLKPNSTIWCPFDTEESNYVKLLVKAGHRVAYSHIQYGLDFFKIEPPECDYIISNPLGAFGFYLLIREIAFIRKESKKKKREKED